MNTFPSRKSVSYKMNLVSLKCEPLDHYIKNWCSSHQSATLYQVSIETLIQASRIRLSVIDARVVERQEFGSRQRRRFSSGKEREPKQRLKMETYNV